MKKVKTYKGFVIAKDQNGEYFVFSTDEWAYGEGLRTAEFECGTDIQEAIDNINSY